MVSVRKRRHADREEVPEPASSAPPPKPEPEPPSMLVRLRNMWQFSCLCQWLYIFGGVAKLDNIDIDELEAQCLSPHSTALQDIGLALLKYLSSHRGLTHELFDEYTRRQYIQKAPQLLNPFGTDELPARFADFSVFQKIRVLHQMTLFVMMNPEKLREKMWELKDAERDQTAWRIEPFGWDRDDRIYYVLDDNRVYRSSEIPAPPPKPKNSKRARAQTRRSNKRRRISTASVDNAADNSEADDSIVSGEKQPDGASGAAAAAAAAAEDDDAGDGPGGMKWECVAVTLEELHALLASIPGKKDPNERILHDKIVEHLLPILEQQEERRKRREKERERELFNLAKMANAKRSSRIAGRQEQLRHEAQMREEEQKRLLELEAARKKEQLRQKMEKERDRRLMSREKRLRERDARRAQHEEELAQLSEDSKNKNPDGAAGRMSERRRLAAIQKNKEALRELEEEGSEEWMFDCICGLYGKVDDGQHSVSCERCNIWQHSKCLEIDEGEAEKNDFHFICNTCKHRAEVAANGGSSDRPVIKIKLSKAQDEPSPAESPMPVASPTKPGHAKAADTDRADTIMSRPIVNGSTNRSTALPFMPLVPSIPSPPESKLNGAQTIPIKIDSSAPLLPKPTSGGGEQRVPVLGSGLGPATTANGNGHAHPFSVPHPGLSQPDLSPRKSHAYGTIYENQPPPSPASGLSSLPEARAKASHKSPTQTPIPAPSLTPGSAQLPRVQLSPTSFATPRLQFGHGSKAAAFSAELPSSPLPPSQGGLSPTKHSPTVVKEPVGALAAPSPTALVLPPTAALSPSAPQQILTPPVKPEGAAHRQSFSGMVSENASPPHEET